MGAKLSAWIVSVKGHAKSGPDHRSCSRFLWSRCRRSSRGDFLAASPLGLVIIVRASLHVSHIQVGDEGQRCISKFARTANARVGSENLRRQISLFFHTFTPFGFLETSRRQPDPRSFKKFKPLCVQPMFELSQVCGRPSAGFW